VSKTMAALRAYFLFDSHKMRVCLIVKCCM
jgi:hypothetical protein